MRVNAPIRCRRRPRLPRAAACAFLTVLGSVAVPPPARAAQPQDPTRVRRVIQDSAVRRRSIARPLDTMVRVESMLHLRQHVVRRMPSVVGLDSLTAARRMTAAGLTRYRIIVPRGDSIAVDTIARQSRRPGDSVAVTDVVFLTLGGQPIVRVPLVVGHRIDTASMIVRRYRLQPIRQVSPATGPPEIVVRQEPQPRTPVLPKSAVTLWVPSEPPVSRETTVVVPNLVRRTRRMAEGLLQKAGLRFPPLVQWERGEGDQLDTVIAQSHAPGSRVLPNTQIGLTFQRAHTLRMPSLIGLDTISAKARLSELQLATPQIGSAAGRGPLLNRIADQQPASGVLVSARSAIVLTLARRQVQLMPRLVGLDTAAANRTLRAVDIVQQRVHPPGSDSIAANRIQRQYPLENSIVHRTTVAELWLGGQPRPPVPNVIGLDTLTALRQLAAIGLTRHRIIRPSGDSVPANIVANQSPHAGESVVVTESVVLTLRGQSTLVVVPNVVHRTRRVAVAQLDSAGLRAPPLVRWEPGQGEQLDTVIAQSHAPGSRVSPNTEVALTLQRGQAQRMPNLIGLDTAAADRRLASIDIRRRRLHRPGGDSIAENRIARQLPLGNTAVQPGTVPDLWLAGRSRPVVARVDTLIVPSVVGLDTARAVRTLAAAGFDSSEVRRPAVGTPIDSVVSQQPRSGERFRQALPVVLTLGAITQIAVPRVTGLRVDSARRVLQMNGLSAGVGGWTPVALRARETVRSQDPDSGQLVAARTTVTLVPDERPALIIVIGLFLGGGLALTRLVLPPPKITAVIDLQPGVALRPSLEESDVHLALGLRGRLVQLPVLHEHSTGSTQD